MVSRDIPEIVLLADSREVTEAAARQMRELHNHGRSSRPRQMEQRGETTAMKNGISLIWREDSRPDLLQVLCGSHHRQAHGLPPEITSGAVESELELWVTPEEEWREPEQQLGLLPDGDLCEECDVARVTCRDCDNEMCPSCGDGCVCDEEEEDDDEDYE